MPTVHIKIILIADSIPDDLVEYQKYLVLFSPIKNISTSFTSQYIRLLYPALLTGYKDGIMITDIDMIPLNKKYYIDISSIRYKTNPLDITICSNKIFENYTAYIIDSYYEIKKASNKTFNRQSTISNLSDKETDIILAVHSTSFS